MTQIQQEWNDFVTDEKPNKMTKIYLVYNESDKIYVASKQNIDKYLKSLLKKQRNKNDKLFNIITSNLYNNKFVGYFEYYDTAEIKQNVNDLNLKLNDKVARQTFINNAVIIGNKKEDNLLDTLKSYFSKHIIQTRKNLYCPYDYIDTATGYKYELKSNNYGVDKYRSAVIDINKIQFDKLFLLFNYTFNRIFLDKETKSFTTKEETDCYYILYNKDKFNTYNRRQIFNNHRQIFCNVIDIPVEDLTYLNPNEKYNYKLEGEEVSETLIKIMTCAVNHEVQK